MRAFLTVSYEVIMGVGEWDLVQKGVAAYDKLAEEEVRCVRRRFYGDVERPTPDNKHPLLTPRCASSLVAFSSQRVLLFTPLVATMGSFEIMSAWVKGTDLIEEKKIER